MKSFSRVYERRWNVEPGTDAAVLEPMIGGSDRARIRAAGGTSSDVNRCWTVSHDRLLLKCLVNERDRD